MTVTASFGIVNVHSFVGSGALHSTLLKLYAVPSFAFKVTWLPALNEDLQAPGANELQLEIPAGLLFTMTKPVPEKATVNCGPNVAVTDLS